MKKLRNIIAIALIITAMSSMYMVGRVSANQAPVPDPYQQVDLSTAQAATAAFMSDARTPSGPVHGFSINMDQYEAMGRIAGAESGIAGFRLYFGTNASHQDVMIVVGINSMGNDMLNSIYSTTIPSSGICPTICDSPSPLMGN